MPAAHLANMWRLDRLQLDCSFAGSRMLRGLLEADGYKRPSACKTHVDNSNPKGEFESLLHRMDCVACEFRIAH